MGLLNLSKLNSTCNTTLDDLRIGSSEVPMIGTMTFHTIGLIIAAASAFMAILLSFYLIFMHAIHYTKPYEQRHIIRILFMIPAYAAASFLQFYYYWHAVYFQVICDCYEAFAIASFFALLCNYVAPDLHEQKMYFRSIEPKPWYFGKYCESSNSPVFAHIWILIIESVAVTIAMYCLIQFYVQLRQDLAAHNPFLKVLAIKLVIFLSFWQSFMISILTGSTLNIVVPTAKIAYPDLKVGIPSLLLCIEMALFAILHLFAFSWKPYASSSSSSTYPMSNIKNTLGPKQGGFLGIKAFIDAMNPWDLVKAFARGMRWLFIGVKNREQDASYKFGNSFDINNLRNNDDASPRTPPHLPIAEEFRRSKFGLPRFSAVGVKKSDDEVAGLIAHAQPNPLNGGEGGISGSGGSGYVPARQRYDNNGQDISSGGTVYTAYNPQDPAGDIGMAVADPGPYQSHVTREFAPDRRREQRPLEGWANSRQSLADSVDDDKWPAVYNPLWPPGNQQQQSPKKQTYPQPMERVEKD
ncbi:related to transmembrane protein 34 [Rhynchosporium agropyri]|uniref:Related to transmembrane protein 34 n=1 Tax=Rhynchosporium agropyri TaxID=914238 RepID=A0A1E1L2Q6_9HELO|nr:related to transmembrane protein 34 [Rhynchosporium agropyri]